MQLGIALTVVVMLVNSAWAGPPSISWSFGPVLPVAQTALRLPDYPLPIGYAFTVGLSAGSSSSLVVEARSEVTRRRSCWTWDRRTRSGPPPLHCPDPVGEIGEAPSMV